MGCDIHLTAEYRTNGVWHNDDLTDAADKYGDAGPRHKEENYDLRLYSGRSYDLFAILANVRNGYGFAGVTTGEGFNPIADPKGIPPDAADITRRYLGSYDSNGHSHSYFTVSELMAYDWTQVTHKTGIVGYRGLARFKLFGKPENWSGSISGPGIVEHDGAKAVEIVNKLTADEPDAKWWDLYHGFDDETVGNPHDRINPQFLAKLREQFGQRPVFRVEWDSPYYETASHFLSNTMPRLWRMGAPDDVRICFFFDN